MTRIGALLLVLGCSDAPSGKGGDDDDQGTDTGTAPTGPDADGDGSPDDADCDDVDPTVRPGIPERCDGLDTDCDEATPDPAGTVGVSDVSSADGGVFATLSDAVAAAGDGATVWLCEGTFTGTAVVETSVRIVGLGAVTLDADRRGPALEIRAAEVEVSDLRVTNGVGSAAGPESTNGGGINAYDSAGPVALVRVVVEENQAQEGGGVLFGAEGGSLVDCEVVGNVAGAHGGGVFSVGDLALSGTLVADNAAAGYGGGVTIAHRSVADLVDSELRGNSAANGGGLFAFEGALVTLGDSLVEDNTATTSGGGIYLDDSELRGPGTLRGNDGTSQAGGVMVYRGGTVRDVEIVGNEAALGAGVWLQGAVTLADVAVTENLANESGGGAYVYQAVVEATATEFAGNTAVVTGGGLLLVDSEVSGAEISDNAAPDGAGVFVSAAGSGGSALAECDVTDNVAGVTGGGIYAAADLGLDAVTLTRNLSDNRAGGLYLTDGATGNVADSFVFANRAVEYGGGIYPNDGATLTLQDTEITANVATRGAGLYLNGGATVSVIGGLVERNGDLSTVTGGGARITDGILVSTGASWGEGPTENLPDDVYVQDGGNAFLGYGSGATFSCDALACAPAP